MDLLRVFFENPTIVFAWQNIPTAILVIALTHGAFAANFFWALFSGSKKRLTWWYHSEKKESGCCVEYTTLDGRRTSGCVEKTASHFGLILISGAAFSVFFVGGVASSWHVWLQGVAFFLIVNTLVSLVAKACGLVKSFSDTTGRAVGGIWETSLLGRFIRGGYRLWQARQVVRKAQNGVSRAYRMLIGDQKDTTAFTEATGKLTRTLQELLEERRLLLSQLERGGTDPVTRSVQETDALFTRTSFQEHATTMIHRFEVEHGDLVKILARIEKVIETIVFVCDNLWIAATGAHADGRFEFLNDLRDQLTGLTDIVEESRGSEILQDISNGGLQRRLDDALRQVDKVSANPPRLKSVSDGS